MNLSLAVISILFNKMQWTSKTFHLILGFLFLIWGSSTCKEDTKAHPNIALIPRGICGPVSPELRITNGKKVSLFQLPWMAMLLMKWRGDRNRLTCGGSLITERYVLTAAHCVGNNLPHVVKLGEISTKTNAAEKLLYGPQEIEVEKSIPHPNFTTEPKPKHDIALLRLSRKADFKSGAVLPICLPIGIYKDSTNLTGRKASAAGWGRTETGKLSADLLRASVPIKDISDCDGGLSAETHMCAGEDETGADTCRGDSGGPLTLDELAEGELRAVQIGISSYGDIMCGTPGYPAVYTKVDHYMKWILDNIEP